mgnify:CR=1 FL=1
MILDEAYDTPFFCNKCYFSIVIIMENNYICPQIFTRENQINY